MDFGQAESLIERALDEGYGSYLAATTANAPTLLTVASQA